MCCIDLIISIFFPHDLARSDQVFGEIWSAPLLCISTDDITGTVEKEIADKEYALKQKPKAKAKAKAADEPACGDADLVMEVDDDVWSIPSDDGMVLLRKSTAAPKKAARNQKHDDAARASRKAARLQAVAWKKEVAKATKFIGSLTSLGTQADSLQQKDVKFPTVLSPELKNGLEEAFKKVHTLKLRALTEINSQGGLHTLQ